MSDHNQNLVPLAPNAFMKTDANGNIGTGTLPTPTVPDLTAVLTAGDNAGGLDIRNLANLYDSSNILVLDVFDRFLKDQAGVFSIDFNGRSMLAVDGSLSIDYSNRFMSDTPGNQALDWGNRLLLGLTSNPVADWSISVLYDSQLFFQQSLDWNNRLAIDNAGVHSINYQDRELLDDTGLVSEDYSGRVLYDNANVESVLWHNRILYDTATIVSVDWANRDLMDSGNLVSIQYEDRQLYVNSEVILDWSNPLFLDMPIAALSDSDPSNSFAPQMADFTTYTGVPYGITVATNAFGNIGLMGAGAGNFIDCYASGGTYASPTQLTLDSQILTIDGTAYAGSGSFAAGTVGSGKGYGQLCLQADENHTPTAMGNRWSFLLTPVGTVSPSQEYLRLDTSGTRALFGNVSIESVGKGLKVKEGSNAKMGLSSMVGGTVVVSNTSVTANSRIFLTKQQSGTPVALGSVRVSARTAGTSFTISSDNVLDTSDVAWMLVEPA